MYYLLHTSNQKTKWDYGLIVLATIQRHSLSQRQGSVFSNQFFCFVWGLSCLGAYTTIKRNMKQFTAQLLHKKLSSIPSIIPLHTVLYRKKTVIWLQNSFVSCNSSVVIEQMSVTEYYAANRFLPLAGHGRKQQFW